MTDAWQVPGRKGEALGVSCLPSVSRWQGDLGEHAGGRRVRERQGGEDGVGGRKAELGGEPCLAWQGMVDWLEGEGLGEFGPERILLGQEGWAC